MTANQTAVLNFLAKKSGQFLSATQIGVNAGSRNPKNASSWAKPILESLVGEGKVSVNEKGFYGVSGTSAKTEKVSKPEKEVKVAKAPKAEKAPKTPKAEKAPKTPKVLGPSVVDLTKLLKDELKDYVGKNRETLKDLPVKEHDSLLKEVAAKILSREKVTSVKKCTLATILAMRKYSKREISVDNSAIQNTEIEYATGDTVEFAPSQLKGVNETKLRGVVTRTFTNDFGYRYLVVKVEGQKGLFTKRDRSVKLVKKATK